MNPNQQQNEPQASQKSIYDAENSAPRGSIINEILWICAGVDRKILRQCPTDHAKYAGIGGTILFTALMAMLSGGYALYTVFDNLQTAICFGIFWGLLIFNLDRFIVNTMYSDGEVTISWQELQCGLPRIIMAIFLGIVISTPLELRIFQSEISCKIEELKKDKIASYIKDDEQKIASYQARIDSLRSVIANIKTEPAGGGGEIIVRTGNEKLDNLYKERQSVMAQWIIEDNEVKTLEKEISRVRNEIRKINIQIDSNQSENDELLNRQKSSLIQRRNELVRQKETHVTNRNAHNKRIAEIDTECLRLGGDIDNMLKEHKKQQDARIADIQREIESISANRDTLKNDMRNEGNKYKQKLDDEFGGFQGQMSAFSKMKEENPSTMASSLFIMLLFIIIETAPTFFKMMIAAGPYDDLLRSEMHRIHILSEKRISDLNDEVNTTVQISVSQNQKRLATEMAVNDQIVETLASAQADIIKEAIELWKQEELKKVQEDPQKYLHQNVGNPTPNA